MRVLLIDTDRCGLDFAWRCVEAGHEVRWFNACPDAAGYLDGEGFPVKRINDWKSSMKWAKDGLIWVSSNAYYLKELDQWKKHGYPIFAPSFASAQLEINRSKGMKFMEKHGLNVPAYHEFKSLQEAENFARKSDQAYVFKTMGDEEDKSLSYVAKNPADLVGRIQRWIKMGMKLKGPCMLQEKIDGIEMGVSCWLGSAGPSQWWNINFEHKKLMPGNYGPNTGEMGTVVQYTKDTKLGYEVFPDSLIDDLMKLGHLGDVDLNCIIEKGTGKVYPLEFTTRPGWPYDWIISDLNKGDPVKWMKDLLDGKDSLDVSTDVGLGEIVAIPEFPYDRDEKEEQKISVGLPVETPNNWRGIHPVCMMIRNGPGMENGKVVEKPIFETSGNYVMCVVGTGKTVSEAKKACDDRMQHVHVSNMIVRNDIGEGLKDTLPALHKMGFAMDMEYE